MCVVSNIGGYFQPRFPEDWSPGNPFIPRDIIPPVKEDEILKKVKDLIDRARAVDAATGDVDCEDPKKTAWMKNIEARLAELEKKNGAA